MDKVVHYLDTFKDGSVDKNATELAGKLRDEKLQAAIYKRNFKKFEIDWTGIDGISLETHSKYFNGMLLTFDKNIFYHKTPADFVTEFYKVMLRLIDRSSKKVATSELSVLKYELQRHLWTLSEAAAWFVGRQQEVATVRRYITGLSRNCFVIYGPPGSGQNIFVIYLKITFLCFCTLLCSKSLK